MVFLFRFPFIAICASLFSPGYRTAEPSPLPNQSFWNQKNYPWTLVRLLPNAQHYTAGRFYSRTEAENHKRFLGKWMPAAQFEVVFDSEAVASLRASADAVT